MITSKCNSILCIKNEVNTLIVSLKEHHREEEAARHQMRVRQQEVVEMNYQYEENQI